ncbi:MAG TPA: glutathione S-transferase C-terminal domain-containing protein [Rhizomicrobium sp.]|nr:glutathione S-transferase C-terminal domain-containing protein [Rhizomicrobium sp.]
MDFVRRVATPELTDDTNAQIARIIDAWMRALTAHDGGFLFGRFSVADCMYAPVVSRFVTYGIETPKPVSDYIARMMALPAMRDWGKAAQEEVDAGIA